MKVVPGYFKDLSMLLFVSSEIHSHKEIYMNYEYIEVRVWQTAAVITISIIGLLKLGRGRFVMVQDKLFLIV